MREEEALKLIKKAHWNVDDPMGEEKKVIELIYEYIYDLESENRQMKNTLNKIEDIFKGMV